MGAAVLKSPQGSCILMTVIHSNSVDRWMSSGDLTTITNDPGPGIEPHSARLNGGNFFAQKRWGKKKVGN